MPSSHLFDLITSQVRLFNPTTGNSSRRSGDFFRQKLAFKLEFLQLIRRAQQLPTPNFGGYFHRRGETVWCFSFNVCRLNDLKANSEIMRPNLVRNPFGIRICAAKMGVQMIVYICYRRGLSRGC